MKKWETGFVWSGVLLMLFVAITTLVMKVDVRQIGPLESEVGLATINQFFFERLGVNVVFYTITDWLGIVAILQAVGFGVLGAAQWVKRRSLLKVDPDILLLGGVYLVVMVLYTVFEIMIVNYRPILLTEQLEASFPSTHTMVVLCIMGTGMEQIRKRVVKQPIRLMAKGLSLIIIGVTVLGRLLAGVHWVADIAAGVLLGSALVLFYSSAVTLLDEQKGRTWGDSNDEKLT
ncbi:MAG: phosphatase PAP2 family protein [Bacillota bacterium]|nr:phosphatase PAP2 family protein [Bacillota bacterium]MDW7677163.1 phosphatase PAP2 family protein [Bacillota bacterium]